MAFFKRTKCSGIVPETDPEGEKELQRAFRSVSGRFESTFQDRNIEVSGKFQKRSWNVRASRSFKNNRHGALKFIGTLTAFLAGTAGTLTGQPDRIQLALWLAMISIIVLLDGIHFFDRFFSLQSRLIISASIICAACYVLTASDQVLKVTGITAGTGLILIVVLNKKWLSAECWLMTEAGQTALLVDVDNESTRAWQGYGRRETRSMLYSLGLESSDDALDVVHRPVWIAGFLSADKRIGKYKERLSRLEARAQEADNLKARLQEAEQDAYKTYEELKQLKSSYNYTAKELQDLQRDYDKLASRQAELIQANEELCQALEYSESPSEAQREAQDALQGADNEKDAGKQAGAHRSIYEVKTPLQRMLDYMAEGYSQTQAGKMIGVSKATASRMIKEARAAGKIPDGHPAAESRPVIKLA